MGWQGPTSVLFFSLSLSWVSLSFSILLDDNSASLPRYDSLMEGFRQSGDWARTRQKVCRKGNPRRSTGAMALNPSVADQHHLLHPAASVFKPIRGIVCFW